MRLMMLMCAVLIAVGCTDAEGARDVLAGQGYSNIETTGYALWGCSSDDEVRTGFVADSPSGRRVQGVVCCGLVFKSCTVRT